MALGVLQGVANAFRRALRSVPADERAALPQVTWAEPGAEPVRRVCPNCGVTSAKPQLLNVVHTPLHRARQSWTLLSCPHCTCCFYNEQPVTDYAGDEMLTRGRAELYVQQGAGLAQIFRPIGRIAKPAGSRVLDIGCGFGFGLDFAIRARGWSGQGLDPAQIAALGRDLLGVPIEQRLLEAGEPDMMGAFDVVMAAETLEHVPDPSAFLRIVASALTPDGVLVLTTPDARALNPSTPPGQLAGLLSPELHVVFQSEASLRTLLEQNGFDAVEIEHDGGALVAYASTQALPLNDDPAAFRALYLDYLEARAGDFEASDDLFWGFAGRGLLEAVNAGDTGRAARLLEPVRRACLEQFGIDLDQPSLPAETATCSLERMGALMPLNFGSILYAIAMLKLATQGPSVSQDATLRLAAEAARQLCRAVGELAMADPMSEDLAWVAEAEALLSMAAADPTHPSLLPRLLALPPSPGSARRDGVVIRIFVGQVNAGRYEIAQALREASPVLSGDAERLGVDGVFCRAVLAIRHGGDAAMARDDFRWVRASLGKFTRAVEAPLFWPALRGEMQALRALGEDAAANAVRSGIVTAIAFTGAVLPDDFASSNRQD